MSALEPDYGQGIRQSTPGLPDLVAQQAQAAPVVPSPTGTTALDNSAILTNLPDARTAFVRKYQELTPMMANLPSDAKAGLLRVDLQRVNKGQAPLSDKETAAVLKAVLTKKAATEPPKDESIIGDVLHAPGNLVGDLRTVVQSIPHLPAAMIHEVQDLPHFAERVQENEDAGMNPLAAILNAPGVRMVPGAFIAGNLAKGTEGIKTLLEHPGLTTLDALPYAGELAATTKVARLAALERGSTAFEAARIAAEAKGLPAEEALQVAAKIGARAEGAGKPLQAVLLRKLATDPVTGEAALAPTKLGEAVTALGRTKPGLLAREAFGTEGRQIAATEALINERIAGMLEGRISPNSDAETVVKATTDFRSKVAAPEYGVSPERVSDLSKAMQNPPSPNWEADLPANEQALVADARLNGQKVQDLYTGRELLTERGGEVFTPDQAKAMDSGALKLEARTSKIVDTHLPALDGMIDQLRANTVTDPELVKWIGRDASGTASREALAKLVRLREAIDAASDPANPGTWGDVNKVLNGINQTRTLPGAKVVGEGAGPKASVRTGWLPSLHAAVKKARAAEVMVEEAQRAVPARWQPMVHELAKQEATKTLIQKGVDPAEALDMVVSRRYGEDFTESMWRRTVKDAEGQWRRLKDEGYDPVFVHHVAPGSEGKLINLRVNASTALPSASKERLLDANSTYWQDVTVGLDHAAREVLQRDVNLENLDAVGLMYARKLSDLEPAYLAKAQKLAEANPRLDLKGAKLAAINEDLVPWNPGQFGGIAPVKAAADPDSLWIPRIVAKHLDRMFNPKQSSFLAAVDPVTGLFRTSVLALSPRWHVYNIVGNALMLMAEEGPQAFRYLPEARRLIKAWNAGDESALRTEIGLSLGSTLKEGSADAASFMEGMKARGAWDKLQETMPAKAFGTLVKKSYQLNGFFDDTTRVMAYLSGERGALGKGLSEGAAADAGMLAARRVSQFWNELSPIERNVLRKVFPFYSFTSKIMRMISRYPMDHPWRAAILANFAEAELADQGNGLPSDWLNSIGIGKPDAQGNQTRISMSGLNPFADAADLFTLSGFIAGANPVIASGLQAIGADAGGSAAYGTQRYDPRTGKLTSTNPGFMESLLSNTIPQIGTVIKASGRDAEFNALLRTNPDAAQRILASGMGLPTSMRKVNEPEVRIKAELARLTAERQALSDALKTGDWSEAEKWPGLRPKIAAIKALQERGLLSEYTPYAGVQPGPSVAVRAVGSIAPWPT